MIKTPKKSFRRWCKSSLALGIFSALLNVIPVTAANKLLLSYGPLKWSLEISSLETFAQEGTIEKDLATYLKNTTPEEKAKFREILTKPIAINPVMMSRFLNTPMGEAMLTRLGKGITIEGGSNGKYALRGALVQAAFETSGFTLLGFLQKLPTNIQFQGEQLKGFAEQISLAIAATELFVKEMEQWTAIEAKNTQPVNFSTKADLRERGKYGVQKETWQLKDSTRNRELYALVYKPIKWREGKTPVIVISHGLSSQPADFSDKAEHLASHGYVVALPQHPGSDLQQLQDMFDGLSNEIFKVDEFINRPKDLSFIIDELERRNDKEFAGRLNLDSVGVFGHSFGGYTALAIAGAQIDFDYLLKECEKPFGGVNTALLLECRALELPRDSYNFRDKRVTSILAANPVNRAIFGPKGLSLVTIPVLLISGSYDPATPPVLEQVGSFTWLKSPSKYLVMAEGQSHVDFSHLDAGITSTISSVGNLTLPKPALLYKYAYALSLAFSEVYVAGNQDYQPYLQSSYAEYLSQEQEFRLDLITAASSDKVVEAIEQFKSDNNIK